MQNPPRYDDEDEEEEQIVPRASLINNADATREIMMRMMAPQLLQQGVSPLEGNYLRGQRVDDFQMPSSGGSSGAGQRLPMMGGQMGNLSGASFGAGGMPDMPQSGTNDEEMLSRMMMFRQQQMATMETNLMLQSMYGGMPTQDTGNRQLSTEDAHRMYAQQRGMGSMGMESSLGGPSSGVASLSPRQQQQGPSGGSSRGAGDVFEPGYGLSPDPRSPSQWRNFPPANLAQRADFAPYHPEGPQRLDIPQIPLQDVMWRHTMASAASQRRSYDDSRFAALSGMAGMADSRKTEGVATPPKKKRRSSRKKPADMPRRPLSAYNLFFSEERERILAEISGEEGTATQSETEPSSEAASKPETASSEASERPDSSVASSDAATQKPQIKALLRPMVPSQKKRRPHRKTHGKISFKELARMVGQRWKNLPEDRKKYYQDLADEDAKRQKIAMEEYYKKQKETEEGSVVKLPGEGTQAAAMFKSEPTEDI